MHHRSATILAVSASIVATLLACKMPGGLALGRGPSPESVCEAIAKQAKADGKSIPDEAMEKCGNTYTTLKKDHPKEFECVVGCVEKDAGALAFAKCSKACKLEHREGAKEAAEAKELARKIARDFKKLKVLRDGEVEGFGKKVKEARKERKCWSYESCSLGGEFKGKKLFGRSRSRQICEEGMMLQVDWSFGKSMKVGDRKVTFEGTRAGAPLGNPLDRVASLKPSDQSGWDRLVWPVTLIHTSGAELKLEYRCRADALRSYLREQIKKNRGKPVLFPGEDPSTPLGGKCLYRVDDYSVGSKFVFAGKADKVTDISHLGYSKDEDKRFRPCIYKNSASKKTRRVSRWQNVERLIVIERRTGKVVVQTVMKGSKPRSCPSRVPAGKTPRLIKYISKSKMDRWFEEQAEKL